MPTVLLSVSQTADNFTEYYLTSENATNGSFVFNVDVSPLGFGDTVQFRVLTSVHATSATRAVFRSTFGVEAWPTVVSIPFPSPFKFSLTLLQSASASRTFDWNVVNLE